MGKRKGPEQVLLVLLVSVHDVKRATIRAPLRHPPRTQPPPFAFALFDFPDCIIPVEEGAPTRTQAAGGRLPVPLAANCSQTAFLEQPGRVPIETS